MKNWDIYSAILLTVVTALMALKLHPILVFGLVVSLFVPGYLTVLVIFPEGRYLKTGERIALSFGMSLVVLTILGLVLNSLDVGITLFSSYDAIIAYNFGMAVLALLRRIQSPLPWYPTISIRLKERGVDKALTILLMVSVLLAFIAVGVNYILPRPWTTFTEIYILNSNGSTEYYPLNLTPNQTLTLRIGLVNHENSKKTYTVQIWLANLSKGDVKKLYYLGSLTISIPPQKANLLGGWRGEYETNVSLKIPYPGTWQLWFIISNQTYGTYLKGRNYANTSARDIIEGAIRGQFIGVKLNLRVVR